MFDVCVSEFPNYCQRLLTHSAGLAIEDDRRVFIFGKKRALFYYLVVGNKCICFFDFSLIGRMDIYEGEIFLCKHIFQLPRGYRIAVRAKRRLITAEEKAKEENADDKYRQIYFSPERFFEVFQEWFFHNY